MTPLTTSLCVIIGLLVVLCGLLTGMILQDNKAAERSFRVAAFEKRNLSASYYQALSMQLANELMSRDPRFYLDQYQQLWSKWKSLENDKKLCKITFSEIAHRKPMQQDFNIINAWDYISVGRALETMTNEYIWDAYEDIKLIQATESLLNDSWYNSAFELDAKDHLALYIKELEDTHFLIEMQSAELIYSDLVHLNDVKFDPENSEIETTSYRFTKLPPLYGSRVGVHIKSSDEYGIIEFEDGLISFNKTDRVYSSVETLKSHEYFAYQSTRKEVNRSIVR